jgi:hypothetical protein
MPHRFSAKTKLFAAALFTTAITLPDTSIAGGVTGEATEFTQLANNAELIKLLESSGTQIENQVKQISQLAEQIQNQLNIYSNMLQNTARLPSQIWGQVEGDLKKLQSVVSQGQGIAFSMGNVDDVLKQRFKSFADLKSNLPSGESFSSSYQTVGHQSRHDCRDAEGGQSHRRSVYKRGANDGLPSLDVRNRRRPNESAAGRSPDCGATGRANSEASWPRLAADDDDGNLVPVGTDGQGSGAGAPREVFRG